MTCMSWTTVLQVRPSGERLVGFQVVCAVWDRGCVWPGEAIWGSLWDHFGLILDIIFADVFLLSAFLKALASIWAPKTPPKLDPKGGQNPNMKFIDFADTYTLWPHSGVLKMVIVRCFF